MSRKKPSYEQLEQRVRNLEKAEAEHEQEKELLRENEKLFSLLLKHSPIYVFFKDSSIRSLRLSKNYEEFLGMSIENALGKTMDELFPSELAKSMVEDDRRILEKGEPVKVIEEYRGRIYETIKFPIFKDGRPDLLAGFTLDITESKRTEEALRKSEEKYRAIIETNQEWIWQINDAGIHTYSNKAIEQILGYSVEEVVGKNAKIYMHPEDRRKIDELIPKCIENKKGWSNLVVRWLHRDGGIRWLESNAVAMLDTHGTCIGFQGSDHDFTERKQAEEEKARLESQLRQAQKMESVGRLAGGVAHDFNNMLGVILGYAEMALDREVPGQPLHADLEEIRRAAKRSAELTRQLLAFARKQTVSPEVLDLNETVAGILKMLERIIGEDIDLTWQPAPGLWQVKVDPSQIDQILTNLCVNARDAITSNGKVIIETGNSTVDAEYCASRVGLEPGEYVLLVVSDDGCGMDKDIQANIFDPFFTTKEVGHGTGLGLAMVYGGVKQNNGFIDVISEPGQGSTFKIYLPRYKGTGARMRQESRIGPIMRGQETILLAEDEPAILNMIQRILESRGYTVLAANCPGEAIRLAREYSGQIHLLMTDVVMPEMNGRELARNLLSLFPDLKRLFTSGYTANVIAHHGVLDNGVYFIQKPFSLEDLVAKVREVLDND